MTIQAKNDFVSDVTEKIGDFLTVTNTKKVCAVLNDALTNYEVERIKDTDISTDLVKDFLAAKQIEGRSQGTINRYSYILEKMVKSIGVAPEAITTAHVRAYLAEEKSVGLSDRSLDGLRCVMSSFFSWSWKEGRIKTNPMASIGAIKYQKKIRHPFSAVEIEKLKCGCRNLSEKALVYFLLATGCRISEACNLNRNDIDFQNLECKVLGKGNKERTVFMDEVTADILKQYLATRTDSCDAVFYSNKGCRYTKNGVAKMLVALGERAGVVNVHPHRFRRTLATNLISHGMSIQEVAAILGHENLDTTMMYVTLNKANIKSSYHKYC